MDKVKARPDLHSGFIIIENEARFNQWPSLNITLTPLAAAQLVEQIEAALRLVELHQASALDERNRKGCGA